MENAYEIARKRSSTAGNRNKHRYDLKLRSIDLQPNDRVLIRNLRERGGPGKLRSFWENEIHVVIRRKDPLSTFTRYSVKTKLVQFVFYIGICYFVAMTCQPSLTQLHKVPV